jgi:hypothetical protein
MSGLAVLDLNLLLIKALAVAGGAGLGAGATGLVLRFAARRFKDSGRTRKVGRPIGLVLRALGAVAAGLAVWLWLSVFESGGTGLFGGQGGSDFGGKGAQGDESQADSVPDGAGPKRSDRRPPVRKEKLQVTMLGGKRVTGGRFYVLEGESSARDLKDVKKTVKDQQQAGVKTIEILIYEDSVARTGEHGAIRDLTDWAKENGFTVTLREMPGEIP